MATAVRTATHSKFVQLTPAEEARETGPRTKATEGVEPVQFRPVALEGSAPRGAEEAVRRKRGRPRTKATEPRAAGSEPANPVSVRPVAFEELRPGDRVWLDFTWKKARIICPATVRAVPDRGAMGHPTLGIRVEPDAVGKPVMISASEIMGRMTEDRR